MQKVVGSTPSQSKNRTTKLKDLVAGKKKTDKNSRLYFKYNQKNNSIIISGQTKSKFCLAAEKHGWEERRKEQLNSHLSILWTSHGNQLKEAPCNISTE